MELKCSPLGPAGPVLPSHLHCRRGHRAGDRRFTAASAHIKLAPRAQEGAAACETRSLSLKLGCRGAHRRWRRPSAAGVSSHGEARRWGDLRCHPPRSPAAPAPAAPPAPIGARHRLHQGPGRSPGGGGRQPALSPATRRRSRLATVPLPCFAASMLVGSHAIQRSFNPASGLRSISAQGVSLLPGVTEHCRFQSRGTRPNSNAAAQLLTSLPSCLLPTRSGLTAADQV